MRSTLLWSGIVAIAMGLFLVFGIATLVYRRYARRNGRGVGRAAWLVIALIGMVNILAGILITQVGMSSHREMFWLALLLAGVSLAVLVFLGIGAWYVLGVLRRSRATPSDGYQP